MLGIQDTPGAAIRRSEVMPADPDQALGRRRGRRPGGGGNAGGRPGAAIVRWFTKVTADLPIPCGRELAEWASHASRQPHTTTLEAPIGRDPSSQLYFALPALKRWAACHDSLREISRNDVLAVLPPSGRPVAAWPRALRSIFRALKARKIIFGNPMFRIHVLPPSSRSPSCLTSSACAKRSIPPTRRAP